MMTENTPLSVVQRFVQNVERFPERPALWARGVARSYAATSRAAAAIFDQLRSSGLADAPRIGIVTGDDFHTYAAILAILANGSAYVPLNKKNPVARNLVVAREADLAAVVSTSEGELREALHQEYGSGLPWIDASTEDRQDGGLLEAPSASSDSLAYVFFTSGSTGTPKGVPITHGNLNQFMSVMLDSGLYQFQPEDRCLQMFELTFDLSVMSLFLPLATGACCYVVPDTRVGYVATLKVLRDEKISVALMVPSLLVYLEPFLGDLRLESLRLSMFCGEALPEAVTEKWHVVAPDAVIENVYGPTEATIFCLRYLWSPTDSPAKAVNGVVPIGVPFPGMQAALLGENGQQILSKDEKGELLLIGGQVTEGYWRNPEKTKEAFVEIDTGSGGVRAYRTGDLCFVNEDGDFIYSGRLDSQIKVDGHRVELGEIEHHLRELIERSNLAVVDAIVGKRRQLVLFLEQPEEDWDALGKRLRERVPEYMIPKHVRYIDSLPLNLNGKVDRPRLRKIAASEKG